MKLSKEFFEKFLKKDKLLMIFLVGILLLIIVIPVSDKKADKSDDGTSPGNVASVGDYEQELSKYKKDLEDELCGVLTDVEGVGKVRVMITLASTSESVVKEDTNSTTSRILEQDKVGGSRETISEDKSLSAVYDSEGGGNTPFIIKENMPSVAGVVVVAEGGGNPLVAQNISDAVKALFGVEIHKIKVMKMSE